MQRRTNPIFSAVTLVSVAALFQLPESFAIICYQCSSYGLPPPPAQRNVFTSLGSTATDLSSPVDPTGCYEINTTTPLIDCPPTSLHCLTAYGIYAGQPVITRGCGTSLQLSRDLAANTDQQRQRFLDRNRRLQPLLKTLSSPYNNGNGCRILPLAISCQCNTTNACNGQSFLDLHSRARVHLALAAPVETEQFQQLQQLQNNQENQLSSQIPNVFQYRSSLPTEATPTISAASPSASSANTDAGRRPNSARFARILYAYDADGKPVIVSASSEPAVVNGQANEVVYSPAANESSSVHRRRPAVGSSLSDSQADALMSSAIHRNLMTRTATTSSTTGSSSASTTPAAMLARNVFVVNLNPEAETTSATLRSVSPLIEPSTTGTNINSNRQADSGLLISLPHDSAIALTESAEHSTTPYTTTTFGTTSRTYHGDYNNLAADAIGSASNVQRLAPLESVTSTTTVAIANGAENLTQNQPLTVSIMTSHGDITEANIASNTSLMPTPTSQQSVRHGDEQVSIATTTQSQPPQSQEIKATQSANSNHGTSAAKKSVLIKFYCFTCLIPAIIAFTASSLVLP